MFLFGGCAVDNPPLSKLPLEQKKDKAVLYVVNHADGIFIGGYDLCIQEKEECRMLTNLTYKYNIAMAEAREGNYTFRIAKKGKISQKAAVVNMVLKNGEVRFFKVSPIVEMMSYGGIGAGVNGLLQVFSDEVGLREITKEEGEELVKSLGRGEAPKYMDLNPR